MTKALISIDYTYDFVADDGKLTAGKPAQEIESALVEATKKLMKLGITSFLPLMFMMKMTLFIQKVSSFPLTISRERADVVSMVN